MKAAQRRDNLQLARTARAVWAGSQLSEEGLSRYLGQLLDIDTALPAEQTMFALLSSTAGLPVTRH